MENLKKKKGPVNDGFDKPLPKETTHSVPTTKTMVHDNLGKDATNCKPKPDTSAAIQWLQGWSENGPWNLTAIPPEGGNNKNRTFAIDQVKAMREFIDGHQGTWNLYFTVNPLMRHVSKKPKKEDVRGLAALHVDIDPRAGEDLVAERERIQALLNSGLNSKNIPDPTAIIDSGGGFQAFWLLKEEVITGGSRERAEELEAFNRQIELLLKADHCHNIDRIMRLPGTINVPNSKKRERGSAKALAKVVTVDWARLYTLEDFKPAPGKNAGSDTKREANAGPIEAATGVSIENLQAFDLSDECLSRIVSGCDVMDATKTDRSSHVFHVLCEMIRGDVPDEVMKAVILDPDFKISAHVLDQLDL